MNASGMPRGPLLELAPPPDGLEVVRREAGRRRRRRALGVALAGGGAVVVAAALAVGSGGAGLAVLQPVEPAVTPTPAVSASPSPHHPEARHATSAGDRHGSSQRRPADRLPAGAGASGGGSDATRSGATTTTSGTRRERAVATYSPEIRLVRSSSRRTQPTVCQGSTYSDGGRLGYGVGWCLTGAATPVADGVRLAVQVCRDATSDGTLSFDSTREVDLSVQRGSDTVWEWAKARPGTPDSHQLATPANGCWTWSLVWPGVDQSGGAAGHGSFTLVAQSTAHELSGMPDETVSFTY